jgi:hypothetical protein
MALAKKVNHIANSGQVRREVEKAEFLAVQCNERKVTTSTGYSSIVGRRSRPLVIKYT